MYTRLKEINTTFKSGLLRVTLTCLRMNTNKRFLTFVPLGEIRVFLDGVGVGVLSGTLEKQNKAYVVTALR